jgi:hypothetical protein
MCRSTAPPSAEPPPIHAADAVFGHEIEGALGAALDADPRLANSFGRFTAGHRA